MVNIIISYDKLSSHKVKLLREKFFNLDIEVDGGVGLDTIEEAAKVKLLRQLVSAPDLHSMQVEMSQNV